MTGSPQFNDAYFDEGRSTGHGGYDAAFEAAPEPTALCDERLRIGPWLTGSLDREHPDEPEDREDRQATVCATAADTVHPDAAYADATYPHSAYADATYPDATYVDHPYPDPDPPSGHPPGTALVLRPGSALAVPAGRHRYRIGGRYNPLPDEEPEDAVEAGLVRAARLADAQTDLPEWAVQQRPERPVLVLIAAAVTVVGVVVLTAAVLPTDQPRATMPPASAPVASTTAQTTPTAPPTTTRTSPPTRTPVIGVRIASRRPTRPQQDGSKPPQDGSKPPSRASRPSLPQLTPLPAALEWSLRSTSGDRSTVVEFVNNRRERVLIYWRDYQGRRVLYRVLPAGGSYRQQTYLTHPWVVTNTSGEALMIFLPANGLARATIR